MTSQGSPYARFRRALATGNLNLIRVTAGELPTVDLTDALAVLLVMAERPDPSYGCAATRWLGRFALECPAADLNDLSEGLDALESLPEEPGSGKRAIRAICARYGLDRALPLLM